MLELPKLYTQFAKYYDRLESQYRDYPKESEWLKSILEKQEATNVIDVSCGTGSHIAKLAEDSSRSYYAMDASKEMVKLAFRKSKNPEFLIGDFLSPPLRKHAFDVAICMYWSLASLDQTLVKKMFQSVSSILRDQGLFIFDVENSEGIKENLLNTPFIDSFFPDEQERIAVIRTNFSTRIESDVVDWRAYYLIEDNGISELIHDRMNLRFYSKSQLERLLTDCGFRVERILSGPYKEYEEHSPSLYFIARKIKDG